MQIESQILQVRPVKTVSILSVSFLPVLASMHLVHLLFNVFIFKLKIKLTSEKEFAFLLQLHLS